MKRLIFLSVLALTSIFFFRATAHGDVCGCMDDGRGNMCDRIWILVGCRYSNENGEIFEVTRICENGVGLRQVIEGEMQGEEFFVSIEDFRKEYRFVVLEIPEHPIKERTL